MTDLKSQLLKLAEFDALTCEDAAIALGAFKIEASKPGHFMCDTEWFDDGAIWENSRLQPLITALISEVLELRTALNLAAVAAVNGVGEYALVENLDAVYNASDARLRKILDEKS